MFSGSPVPGFRMALAYFTAISVCGFLGMMVFSNAEVSLRFQKQGLYTFGNFLKRINGLVLQKNNSLLSQSDVESDTDCASLCVMDRMCLSVNFGVSSKTPVKVQCELYGWGGSNYHDYLVKKEGFFHMRMETVCSINPCDNILSNLTCIPFVHNSAKMFSCACPESHNIRRCETDSAQCNALGIEDRTILDSQMSASSSHSLGWAASKGRLFSQSTWLVGTGKEANCWLQVDLMKSTAILGIATQGTHNGGWRTKTYQLGYSVDRVTWSKYKEAGIEKIFQGNVHNNAVVKHELRKPFLAKLVRFYPKTWVTSAALRIELYGCHK